MKFRLALITIILSAFGLILTSQINMANAQVGTPLTSPITYFTYRITGKVNYNEIYRGFFRSSKPAQNVTITAVDVKSNKTYSTTKTDINGNYVLDVKNRQYLIIPSDSKRTLFTPSYAYINVTKNIANLNFTGIIRK